MSLKLCTKFGLVAGGAVGVLVNLLQWLVSAVTPTIAQLSLDGLVVALITMTLAAAFACLIRRELSLLIFFLAFLIGAVVGIVLGPVAYYLPDPGLALVVCAVLGALIGLFICRLLCRARAIADQGLR